jgi:hypothetical protein
MKTKTHTFRFILTVTALSVFIFALGQNVFAQRYLSELKDRNEPKGIAQFGDDLAAFLKLAEEINAKPSIVSPRILAELDRLGRKVKEGTSNFRSNLKGLVAKFKSDNRWDDKLDGEINETLGSRKVKGFFQRVGGRKILNDSDGAINAINIDVDAILSDAKKLSASITRVEDTTFMKTSFAQAGVAPSALKLRFKCVVLGVAIFGAEIAKAPKTAENLDNIFDSNGCGSGTASTTE